jgi:hypothetical protein
MRKFSVALMSALLLAGCKTPAPEYGNHLQPIAMDQRRLADDAVKQLVALYPPAKVRLELQQPTPDEFGAALIRGLRDSGYALLEFSPEAPMAKAPAAQAPPDELKAQLLRYMIDRAGTSNLYRLSLAVGSQSLTRPYLEQGGALVPAGYWVRKE